MIYGRCGVLVWAALKLGLGCQYLGWRTCGKVVPVVVVVVGALGALGVLQIGKMRLS